MSRLKDLVEHFELHQSEAALVDEEISFLDFLYEHYVQIQDHNHEDQNSHDQLPFSNVSPGQSFWMQAHFDYFRTPIKNLHFTISNFVTRLSSQEFLRILFRPPSF